MYSLAIKPTGYGAWPLTSGSIHRTSRRWETPRETLIRHTIPRGLDPVSGKGAPSMFVAVYLLLLREEKVLPLRCHNTAYEDGNYSVIAGHVEHEERITQALVHEAAEEARVALDKADLHFVHVMQRKDAEGLVYLDFFFVAEQWEGQVQNCKPSKCDDLRWFPLTALPQNTMPHLREVLGTLQTTASGFREYGWDGRDQA